VVEDLGRASLFRYRFTDPDAFLACDSPVCSVPWVTRTGLVSWAISDDPPSCTLFADRVVVACGRECLAEALNACGRGRRRWSQPMAVDAWLDALRDSLDCDPERTPIGEFNLSG
jgi:hypothetical protein